jgi:hypothetical protein
MTDMLASDPLKIYYFVVLRSENPKDATFFQGFSTSWQHLHWALHRLATVPADVLEKSYALDDVIAQRMGDLARFFDHHFVSTRWKRSRPKSSPRLLSASPARRKSRNA